MGRPPCCEKVGIKKGPWTPEEDIILVSYIQEHGPGNWRAVPTNTGLMRCSKSCRLRWTNYLRPGIKRGNFTPHEEGIIIHLQSLLGNRWAAIASYLPQRTDNDIKNYWNTHLKKRINKFQMAAAAAATTSTVSPGLFARSDCSSEGCSAVEAIRKEGAVATRFPLPILPSPPAASNYACSAENISRLLQGWVASSSSKDNSNNNDDDVSNDEEGNKKKDKRRGQPEPNMASFENMSGIASALEASFDAGAAARPEAEAEAKGVQRMEKGRSNNDDEEDDGEPPLPLLFLEKWLFDEASAASPGEGLMELPAEDCCSDSLF